MWSRPSLAAAVVAAALASSDASAQQIASLPPLTAPLADAPLEELGVGTSFGAIVRTSSTADLLVIGDTSADTVSVFDAETLALEASDLMALVPDPDLQLLDALPIYAGSGGANFDVVVVLATTSGVGKIYDFRRDGSGAWTFARSVALSTSDPFITRGKLADYGGSGRSVVTYTSTDSRIETFFPKIDSLTIDTSTSLPSAGPGDPRVLSLAGDFGPNGVYISAVGVRDSVTFEHAVVIHELDFNSPAWMYSLAQVIPEPASVLDEFGSAVAFTASGPPGFPLFEANELWIGSPGAPGGGRVDLYRPAEFPFPQDVEFELAASFHNEFAEPMDRFGSQIHATFAALDAQAVAISEDQNEFQDDVGGIGNFSGTVRLLRPDGAGEWDFSGEVFQSVSDAGAFGANFGDAVEIAEIGPFGSEQLKLFVGAPGIDLVSIFDVAEESWVVDDASPALAPVGGDAPELQIAAGLYSVVDFDDDPGPLRLRVQGAPPFTFGSLVVGIGIASAPFKQGVLFPTPDILVTLPTDGAGAVDLITSWPTDLPAAGPFDINLQYWFPDPAGPKGFTSTAGAQLRQN